MFPGVMNNIVSDLAIFFGVDLTLDKMASSSADDSWIYCDVYFSVRSAIQMTLHVRYRGYEQICPL
jgi:hypothetical protein